MQVAVSGSGGLIGSQLCTSLLDQGHRVVRIRRGSGSGAEVVKASEAHGERSASWVQERPEQLAAQLEGVDAVVHLAGEPIAEGRWDNRKKTRIYESRVTGTESIVSALAVMAKAQKKGAPKVLLCASGVGIYGDRDNEVLKETSKAGNGFLAEVCKGWERAAARAVELGVRVVHMRFGIVLSANGGALAKMLPPFRLGLGGPIGSGNQYVSWMSLEDAIRAIFFAIENDSISRAVNFVAPGVVTNLEFAQTLAKKLGRPSALRMPAWALRLAAGGLADEALLASQRATPEVLENAAFSFSHATLKEALDSALSPTSRLAK